MPRSSEKLTRILDGVFQLHQEFQLAYRPAHSKAVRPHAADLVHGPAEQPVYEVGKRLRRRLRPDFQESL